MRIIQQYNDKLAKVYDDATKAEFKWQAPTQVNKLLLSRLSKNSRILDLGIGTGQSSEAFYKAGHKIVGVDLSSEMIKIARKKLPKAKFYRFDIENGLEKLGFGAQSFDAIIAAGVVEFIKDLAKTFKASAIVIKTEGFFCFTFEEYIREHKIQGKRENALGQGLVEKVPKLLSFKVYRRTLKEIEILLEDNGFKVISAQKFIGYFKTKKKIPVHYLVVLAKHG